MRQRTKEFIHTILLGNVGRMMRKNNISSEQPNEAVKTRYQNKNIMKLMNIMTRDNYVRKYKGLQKE